MLFNNYHSSQVLYHRFFSLPLFISFFSSSLSLSLSLYTHFCCVVEMKKSSSTPEKLDRKTVERNRRIHMKALCVKLTSLIPPNHFKPSKVLSLSLSLSLSHLGDNNAFNILSTQVEWLMRS
ncbi:hypothetical protein HYC85_029456 [Camellia sinensis]|uniref:BHLH domain-containing protein n=1 Tax=Camellia sinensis TaxID=4442 RepID=A0A7J7FYN7_CAMSI|nr:hypothetical protein HYC85_029456 [Camellia sinensis]